MNCLITAASTAWAYKVRKLLKNTGKTYFGDCYALPGISSPDVQFITLPKAGSEAFAHNLLTLCLDLEITCVYPLREEELVPLAESALLFSEFGITVCVPGKEELKDYDITTSGNIVIVENGNITTPDGEKYSHIPLGNNGIFAVTDAHHVTIFALPHADLR